MDNQGGRHSLRTRIRDGLIVSVEELKAEFKEQAKRTHPDLAGADATEAFVRLRRDYEAALSALGSGHRPSSSGSAERAASDFGDPFAALRLLIKRGFPKQPRHEKERLRYAYARIRARESVHVLADGAELLFDRFEEELFALKAADERDFRATLRLFSDLVAARLNGSEVLIAALRMEIGHRSSPLALGASPKGNGPSYPLGPDTAAFLRILAGSETA